jgi:hypothetical protein
MADPTLLDAVTAGIENLGETPPTGDNDARAEADAAVGDTDESANGDGGGEAGSTGAAEDTDAAADADASDEGAAGDEESGEAEAGKEEGDKGGKVAKTGTVKEEGADKSGADPVKAAQEKLDKAVNDPIDQRLKESTRERIQLLANEVKTMRPLLENANLLVDSVSDSGMSPDELATMLGYAHARHKGTAEQKRSAYEFLKSELRAFALELGEVDTVAVDFLGDHQDLKDAVANNQITEAHAKELALARSRAKVATDTAAATDEHAQAQREHAAGRTALVEAGNALSTRDGTAVYNAKVQVLSAALKPVLAQLHPSKWAETFKRAYEALPKPAPVQAPPAARPAQQPLRSATMAGGSGKKEPKSMKDAVFAALGGEE